MTGPSHIKAGEGLDTVDLLDALSDLDAAVVVIGSPSGTRVAVTVTLDRRGLLDDLLGGPPEECRSAWLDLLDEVDALLPGDLSLWSLRPGQVVTLPVRAALERMVEP